MLKNFINKYILKPKIKIAGSGNTVSVSSSAYLRKVRFNVFGNNNSVVIDDNVYLHNTKINIGFPDCPINNCKVYIGKCTSANALYIQLGESNSEVKIGDNTMISFNVEVSCTDTHAILDYEGNLLNAGKFIEIGSNVWICKNTVILKNTKVPDGCIVAQNSTVTKCFETQNCVLAGNPAKVVKENIKWSNKRPENARKKEK